MWVWLTGFARPEALGMAGCQTVYTDWQLTHEERLNEDAWVVAYRHYERTRMDSCTGQSTTETKTEGPTQLWPAVPRQRVADVSRPQPHEGTVSGTPLRSSDGTMATQASVQVGPEHHRTVPTEQKLNQMDNSPVFPLGLALLAGAMAYTFVKKRMTGAQAATPSTPEHKDTHSAPPPAPGTSPSNFREENGTHIAPDVVVEHEDGIWTWHWRPQYEIVTETVTVEEEVEIRVPEEIQIGYKVVSKTVKRIRTERVKVGSKIKWERISYGQIKVPVQKTRTVEKEVTVGYKEVKYQDGYDVRTRQPLYRTERFPIKERREVEETYWTEEWQEDFDMIPRPIDIFEERPIEEYITIKVREPLYETHWVTNKITRPVEKVVSHQKLVGWTGEWSHQARASKEPEVAPATGLGLPSSSTEAIPISGDDPLSSWSSPEASPLAVGDLHAALIAAKHDWWRAWLRRDHAGMVAAHEVANLLRARGAREATEAENEEAKLSVLNPALIALQHQWWDAKIRRDEEAAARAASEGQRLRSEGASVPLAETQAMSKGKLHDALVAQKHAWWNARLNDNQDGMNTAHEMANYLRALGAVVSDDETARINAQYEPQWQEKLRQAEGDVAGEEPGASGEDEAPGEGEDLEKLRAENGLTPGDVTSTPSTGDFSPEDLSIIEDFYGILPALIMDRITPSEAKFIARYIQEYAGGFNAPRQYPEEYAQFYVLLHRLQGLHWDAERVQKEIALATGKVFGRSQLEAVWSGSFPGRLTAMRYNPEDLFVGNDGDSAFLIGFLLGSDYVVEGNVLSGIAGDTLAGAVLWGDLRDAVIQGYKLAVGDDNFEELTFILALVGVLLEAGWLNGPIPDPVDVGNAALSSIKASLKRVPKDIRNLFAQAIRSAAKDLSTFFAELQALASAAKWVGANQELVKQIRQAGGGISEFKWIGQNVDLVKSIVSKGGSGRHLVTVARGGKYTQGFLRWLSKFPDTISRYLPNMSVAGFRKIATQVADKLSPQQVELVKSVRNRLPSVDPDTLMQKVIHPEDIEKYLTDGNTAWKQVRGFNARAQDVQDLNTSSELVEGLSLLYKTNDGRIPFEGVKSVGVIRFKTSQADQLVPAYGPKMGGNITESPPFTGTGFTGSQKHLIPEFHSDEFFDLQDGAELWEFFEDGTQVLRGIFIGDEKRFIKVAN